MVAERFGKRHDNVIRDIEDLIGGLLNFEDTPKLFQKSMYQHEQNRQLYPEYLMNRDGFTMLAMRFTGDAALEWQWKFVQAFNDMEAELRL